MSIKLQPLEESHLCAPRIVGVQDCGLDRPLVRGAIHPTVPPPAATLGAQSSHAVSAPPAHTLSKSMSVRVLPGKENLHQITKWKEYHLEN